jgi:hypothetical protein
VKIPSWLFYLIVAAFVIAAATFVILRYVQYSEEQQKIYILRLKALARLPSPPIFPVFFHA